MQVDALHARYGVDEIYTWVGDMLVAINPFKQLRLYDEEVAALYVDACVSTIDPLQGTA